MTTLCFVELPFLFLCRKLPRDRQAQIESVIDEMESDPMAGDVIPLKGSEWKGRFRKRVGPYRIIFAMNRKAMTVDISAILIRSEKTYR
jgi:mRNA-degrading endonuclease RelE of RelBE toxin-antitoxin system